MLQYAKLIKHPVPPPKAEYLELCRNHEVFSAYTAEVIDGVLAVTVYECRRREQSVTAVYRHFYNGETYATEDIENGSKCLRSISSCLNCGNWFWLSRSGAKGADKVINAYLGIKGGALSGESALSSKERHLDIEKANRREQKIADAINARMSCITEEPPEFWDWVDSWVFANRKRSPSNRAKVTYIQPTVENGKNVLVERTWYVWKEADGMMDAEECGRVFYSAGSLKYSLGGWREEYGYSKEYRWMSYRERGVRPCSGSAWIYPHNLDAILRASGTTIRNVEASAIVPHIKTSFTFLLNILEALPCFEGLVKVGCYKLAWAVHQMCFVGRHFELHTILRRRKASPAEALRISRADLKLLGDVSEKEFLLFFYLCKQHKADFATYRKYCKLKLYNKAEDIDKLLKEYPLGTVKLANYLEKQAKRQGKRKADSLVGVYADYLSMAKDLRLPKTESVMYPKDVQLEHDRLVKIQTDREYSKQNRLLKKRVEILEMLDYADKNFLIRPLRSADEFLKESSVLCHCVKTYIDRCARGEKNIYGIRKVSDPETPYFTLTLSNEAIVTVNLGKNNCHPPQEVKDFVEKWKKKVISKKKQEFIEAANPPKDKEKVRITA